MGSPGLNNRNNGQRLGITEPISLGGPTDFDVIKTRELEKVWSLQVFSTESIRLVNDCFRWELRILCAQFLAEAGLYESQEEAVSREEVLGRLDQVVLSTFINISCSCIFFNTYTYVFGCCKTETDSKDVGEKHKPCQGTKWGAGARSQC